MARLTPNRVAVLRLMRDHGPVDSAGVAAALECSTSNAWQILQGGEGHFWVALPYAKNTYSARIEGLEALRRHEMRTIRIHIAHDAEAAHFIPDADADNVAPYSYDLMVSGLDAEEIDLLLPGHAGIAQGAVVLEGTITAAALHEVEALGWVAGVAVS